ncbi:hypothetical protein [Tunturiibacter psychrotolerans]|uniref:hypothetical protein n=1 Tax=Tunturiibacter psychrotolerans TaxID=3069686 RepID=UPI003D25BA01
MAESTEIKKGSELEFLLKSLPQGDGVPKLTAADIAAALAKEPDSKKAAETLQKIAASDKNKLPGSTEVRVGPLHIKLKKLIRSAACSVFFLGISTVDASKVTFLAGVEQGLEFLAAFAESLEKLSPTEIMLYDIIAEIETRNRFPHIDPKHLQGTEQDIQTLIRARGYDLPRDFKDALIGLLNKKAIESAPGAPNDPIYRPIF